MVQQRNQEDYESWVHGGRVDCSTIGNKNKTHFLHSTFFQYYNHFNILFGLEPRPTSQGCAGRLKDEIQHA